MAKQALAKRGTPDAALRARRARRRLLGLLATSIEFADEGPRARDHVFEFDGLQASSCDPKSLLYLRGSVLDYEKSQLMQHGFKFQNPNEKTQLRLRRVVHGLDVDWRYVADGSVRTRWASRRRFDLDLAAARAALPRAVSARCIRTGTRGARAQRAPASRSSKAVEVNEAYRALRDPTCARRGAAARARRRRVRRGRTSRSRSRAS